MAGKLAIGASGLFLFVYGIWNLIKDVQDFRTNKDFGFLLFLFSISVPLVSIIIGLLSILLFSYIIRH